nr:HK97 gp10 family phage protein [uncultured Aminipila sp.]
MGVMIDINNLQSAIGNILEEYADEVYQVTEEGLDDAANVLIKNLKVNTPEGETKKLRKSWKVKKYKAARYVHNTKMVEGENGEIPLINIVEYSPTKGKPFVKTTFNESVDEMAKAVVNKINRMW